jgi:hypothetical protein
MPFLSPANQRPFLFRQDFDQYGPNDGAAQILIRGFVIRVAGDERQPTAVFMVYS